MISLTFHQKKYIFTGLSLLALLSLFIGIYIEKESIFAVPFVLLVICVAFLNFKWLFYLLFFFIPLSTELKFTSGLATDIPTEPLMILLMGVFIIYIILKPERFNIRFLHHPLILLLLLQYIWVFFTALHSEIPVISFKFFLAKAWYLIVFVFMTGLLIKSSRDIKIFFWVTFPSVVFVSFYMIINHASYGFTFADVNRTMQPFFHNHVNFAALLSLFFPFVLLGRKWYRGNKKLSRVINMGMLIILAGIIFSYTRGTWLAMIIAGISYLLIKRKLFKPFIWVSLIFAGAILFYLANENKYLDHAPNYYETVYHEEFEQHMQATYELQDVSTAERFYRWIAAFRMSKEELITGYGPGTFYHFYKQFTVSSYRTWVSQNIEKSGVHNYFLMMLTDQGLPGFLLFLIFSVYLLIKGQQIYHQTRYNKERQVVMAAFLTLIIIYVTILLSDLIEVDKVGSFYYFCITLLVIQDLKNERDMELKILQGQP